MENSQKMDNDERAKPPFSELDTSIYDDQDQSRETQRLGADAIGADKEDILRDRIGDVTVMSWDLTVISW